MTEENEIKFADLPADKIEEIKLLEEKLGEDLCLIAVEKNQAIYALEVKLAPNRWQRIDEAYPEIEGLRPYYSSYEKANSFKAVLKSFLNSQKVKGKIKKRPIRIRKITGPEL
jgi:hypothetical protein